MASCEIVVGRLLEIDIAAGFRTPAEVDTFANIVGATLASGTHAGRLVLVADWRRCQVLQPQVAERVLAMLRRNSPLIERNAVLHASEQATSLLQIFRVVQQAENPHRRLFTEPAELEHWLSDVLDPAEQSRLHLLLTNARAKP